MEKKGGWVEMILTEHFVKNYIAKNFSEYPGPNAQLYHAAVVKKNLNNASDAWKRCK